MINISKKIKIIALSSCMLFLVQPLFSMENVEDIVKEKFDFSNNKSRKKYIKLFNELKKNNPAKFENFKKQTKQYIIRNYNFTNKKNKNYQQLLNKLNVDDASDLRTFIDGLKVAYKTFTEKIINNLNINNLNQSELPDLFREYMILELLTDDANNFYIDKLKSIDINLKLENENINFNYICNNLFKEDEYLDTQDDGGTLKKVDKDDHDPKKIVIKLMNNFLEKNKNSKQQINLELSKKNYDKNFKITIEYLINISSQENIKNNKKNKKVESFLDQLHETYKKNINHIKNQISTIKKTIANKVQMRFFHIASTQEKEALRKEKNSLLEQLQNSNIEEHLKLDIKKIIHKQYSSFSDVNYDIDTTKFIEELKRNTLDQIDYIKDKNHNEISWKYLTLNLQIFWNNFSDFSEREKNELFESLNTLDQDNIPEKYKSEITKFNSNVVKAFETYNSKDNQFNVYSKYQKLLEKRKNSLLKIAYQIRTLEQIKQNNFINSTWNNTRMQNLENAEVTNSDKFLTMMNPFNENSVFRQSFEARFFNIIFSLQGIASFIPLLTAQKIHNHKVNKKSKLESNRLAAWVAKKIGLPPQTNDIKKLKQLHKKIKNNNEQRNTIFLKKQILRESRNAAQRKRLKKDISHAKN